MVRKLKNIGPIFYISLFEHYQILAAFIDQKNQIEGACPDGSFIPNNGMA